MSITSDRPVVLVTGGGSGIGAATVAAFAAEGYDILAVGRRRAALDAVASATGAATVCADLDEPDAAESVIETVRERFGRLDTLVLNAGITREGSFAHTSDDDWAAMLSTNLVAAARLARHALPELLLTRGSIVGVASVAALRSNAMMAGYSASKAGLVALVQSIAVEYGEHGVRANVVCPGWVRTEMADAELGEIARRRGVSIEETYAAATSFVPLRRAAEPAEIATVIAFLASPAASFVTGAALPIDGGSVVSDAGALAL